jgi:hypothetical protein
MTSSKVLDVLIIGTGPSAVAAAMALRRRGVAFEVADVGFDLEADRELHANVLARQEPSAWCNEHQEYLFPPPNTSAQGVERRFLFGSNFMYRMPEPLELRTENCVIDVSHGFGGFGNVWGAAILPFVDDDMVGWPIKASDLKSSYRNVAEYVPISSVADDLEAFFPRSGEDGGNLIISKQTEELARLLSQQKVSLQQSGIVIGRSRVAVDSTGGSSTCRYCGRCLDGCAYGSIFNPRQLWKKLEQEGIVIHRGLYALEFKEHDNIVHAVFIDLKSNCIRVMTTRRLLLGAGAINSTRIVARSLHLEGKSIPLKDSQYFFFPFLSYRAFKPASECPSFTLTEIFAEVRNSRFGPFFTHFQIYGLNSIFQQTIRTSLPRFLRWPSLLDWMARRFFLFQGFLHSEVSGRLDFTLEASEETRDRIKIRGLSNPASVHIARGAQRLLRNKMLSYGLIPPFFLKMVPLGRSFHVGGSFPMGGNDPVFRSDCQGRPADLRRVHFMDAASFPSIPATTITFSIMANSDRIVEEILRQPK